jgi:hypothetical protein
MINIDAIKQIAEGARKMAGEQIATGKRKGISRDGQIIEITIKPASMEGDEKEGGEMESPMKKKLREYGIVKD